QIFITDCNPTRLKSILDEAGGEYALFTVENGEVRPENGTAATDDASEDGTESDSRPANPAEEEAK
ncbi:MAG: DNA replication and repair protein RecF, partial [Alistipes sp.]|nr:DNA replication and repair protein RecF [Alistipes sp.]